MKVLRIAAAGLLLVPGVLYAQTAAASVSSEVTTPDLRPRLEALVAETNPLPFTSATPAAIRPAPQRPDQTAHEFFDRQQKIGLYAHSVVRVADTIKTCRELSHGGVEVWIPSQSCAGIAAWQAGSVGLALATGWFLHKHGYHRLERIVPWVASSASAAGLTRSVLNIR